jgi:hypothetical protein
MMIRSISVVLLLLLNGIVGAFTIPSLPKAEVAIKNAAGTFIAASTIVSNIVIMNPSMADASTTSLSSSFDVTATTQLLAARSGGRAGGRSSSMRSAPSTRSVAPQVIERRTTTVIQQPMYTSPGIIMSPGYYTPSPSGLGLAIGLNAVSGIADGFREARQENEIRSTREQLNESRIREAEMAARLRALEQNQQLQQQQQLMMTK